MKQPGPLEMGKQMGVIVSCPQCGTQYSVERERLGRRSKCAKCGAAFVLSAPVEPAPSVVSEQVAEPNIEDFAAIPQFEIVPPAKRVRTPAPPQPAAVATAGAAGPSFWALRLLARSYEVFAVISLVAIMIPLVLMVQALVQFPTLASLVVLRYCLAIVSLLASALIMFLIAQLVRLILQVEQNTRETSIACQRLAEHLCAIESAD
jgi:predicted Zn finger-like uncharacterized protein